MTNSRVPRRLAGAISSDIGVLPSGTLKRIHVNQHVIRRNAKTGESAWVIQWAGALVPRRILMTFASSLRLRFKVSPSAQWSARCSTSKAGYSPSRPRSTPDDPDVFAPGPHASPAKAENIGRRRYSCAAWDSPRCVSRANVPWGRDHPCAIGLDPRIATRRRLREEEENSRGLRRASATDAQGRCSPGQGLDDRPVNEAATM